MVSSQRDLERKKRRWKNDPEYRSQRLAYARQRRETYKKLGLCINCGKPMENMEYAACPACREKNAAKRRDRYYSRQPEEQQKQADYFRRRRNRFIDQHLCAICGQVPPQAGYVSCMACRILKSKQYYERKERKCSSSSSSESDSAP